MELAGFAELLERLAYVGRDLFRVSLKAQLAPTMVRKAASAASHNTFAFGKFLHAILSFDQDLALQLVEDNAAPLAEAFAKAPLDTFEDLDHVIWFVLSFDMGLGIVSKPKPAQRKLAKRLCARLDPGACARSIESGRLRDLERWARLLFFVKRADPRLTRRIISELNFEKLDTWLQPFWAKPRHELEHFVMALAFRPEFEPARSWVAKHVNDLREIPPRFAIIAPEATAEALRAGARIAYPESFGLVWDQIVGALALLARVDKTLAEESLKTQVDALARSLTTHQANLYEKADRFLSLSEEILPGTARTIIDRMDPELALNHWPQLLKGNAAQRRTLKRLLDTALETRGPMKKVAETVRRRGTSKRK